MVFVGAVAKNDNVKVKEDKFTTSLPAPVAISKSGGEVRSTTAHSFESNRQISEGVWFSDGHVDLSGDRCVPSRYLQWRTQFIPLPLYSLFFLSTLVPPVRTDCTKTVSHQSACLLMAGRCSLPRW
jgi:hypothetical protein